MILSAYFKKRRALATGLAVGGGSLGQLSIPLLFNFLVEYYGFQVYTQYRDYYKETTFTSSHNQTHMQCHGQLKETRVFICS